jgi:hypothetical protein
MVNYVTCDGARVGVIAAARRLPDDKANEFALVVILRRGIGTGENNKQQNKPGRPLSMDHVTTPMAMPAGYPDYIQESIAMGKHDASVEERFSLAFFWAIGKDTSSVHGVI